MTNSVSTLRRIPLSPKPLSRRQFWLAKLGMLLERLGILLDAREFLKAADFQANWLTASRGILKNARYILSRERVRAALPRLLETGVLKPSYPFVARFSMSSGSREI